MLPGKRMRVLSTVWAAAAAAAAAAARCCVAVGQQELFAESYFKATGCASRAVIT
jgi:hypothetical protein